MGLEEDALRNVAAERGRQEAEASITWDNAPVFPVPLELSQLFAKYGVETNTFYEKVSVTTHGKRKITTEYRAVTEGWAVYRHLDRTIDTYFALTTSGVFLTGFSTFFPSSTDRRPKQLVQGVNKSDFKPVPSLPSYTVGNAIAVSLKSVLTHDPGEQYWDFKLKVAEQIVSGAADPAVVVPK